jgi:hypothetical protein
MAPNTPNKTSRSDKRPRVEDDMSGDGRATPRRRVEEGNETPRRLHEEESQTPRSEEQNLQITTPPAAYHWYRMNNTKTLSAIESFAIHSPKRLQAMLNGYVELQYPTPSITFQSSSLTLSYPTFDPEWTLENEAELRKSWTVSDETVLRFTSPPELMLWIKSNDLFGVAPPLLLPIGAHVDLSDNSPITNWLTKHNVTEMILENKNWDPKVCYLLMKILSCIAFKNEKDDIGFLRNVLQRVLHLRPTSNYQPSPCTSWIGPDNAAIGSFLDPHRSDLSSAAPTVIDALIERLDTEESYYADFNEVLTDFISKEAQSQKDKMFAIITENVKSQWEACQTIQVKQEPGGKLNIGLTELNLMTIIYVWDKVYTQRPGKGYGLKTMDEQHDEWTREIESEGLLIDSHTISTTLGRKRDWIMSCRRKYAMERKAENIALAARENSQPPPVFTGSLQPFQKLIESLADQIVVD